MNKPLADLVEDIAFKVFDLQTLVGYDFTRSYLVGLVRLVDELHREFDVPMSPTQQCR